MCSSKASSVKRINIEDFVRTWRMRFEVDMTVSIVLDCKYAVNVDAVTFQSLRCMIHTFPTPASPIMRSLNK